MLSSTAIDELGRRHAAPSTTSLSSASTIPSTSGSGADTSTFSLSHFLDTHVLPSMNATTKSSRSSISASLISSTSLSSLDHMLTELRAYNDTLIRERDQRAAHASHDVEVRQLMNEANQVNAQVTELRHTHTTISEQLQRFLTTHDTQRITAALTTMHSRVSSIQVTCCYRVLLCSSRILMIDLFRSCADGT
jgi:hypothetical protein